MIGKSIYILKVYSIHYTLLSRAPTHHGFTFNLRFKFELKRKVHVSKMSGIFHFRVRLVFIKVFIFVQQKSMDSLTLKRHNFFQN